MAGLPGGVVVQRRPGEQQSFTFEVEEEGEEDDMEDERSRAAPEIDEDDVRSYYYVMQRHAGSRAASSVGGWSHMGLLHGEGSREGRAW